MGENRLRDLAAKYYMEKNTNCAEAILLAANEKYKLHVGDEEMKLVSGFGGGMGCGSTCGALAGSIAVIGKVLVSENAHSTPGFSRMCRQLVVDFEKKLGGIDCKDIVEKYRNNAQGCLLTVELAADVLEEFIKNKTR